MKTNTTHPLVPNRPFRRTWRAVGLCIALTGVAAAVDVPFIGVLKGQRFTQSGQDLASLGVQSDEDDQLPLAFEVMADGMESNSLVSGSVQLPGGGSVSLTREYPGDSGLRYEFPTESLLDLDTTRPNGTHTVNLVTTNDGPKNIDLTLTGDAYPNVPLITNFNALQSAQAASDTTIQWSPMTGGTASDFILCVVSERESGETIHESGMPGSPTQLDGTAEEFTIPAGTLEAGHSYEAEVIFVKIVDLDTTYTTAVAGYYKLVKFDISTAALPATALGSMFETAIPQDYTNDVPRDSAVTFRFSKPMAPDKSIAWTINSSPVNSTDFSYEWIDGNKVLLCRYNTTLPANATIGWTLNLGGFRDAANFVLSGSANGSFQTSSEDPESPPDVMGIYVTKIQGFQQTGTSPVSSGMWGCDPEIEMPAFNRVKSATLTMADNGRSGVLRHDAWNNYLTLENTYASKPDFDRFFANGDYTFSITPLADAPVIVTLSLGATDDYPSAPTVTNLAALQSINPSSPMAITWNALAGWSQELSVGSGMIELEIKNSSGDEVVWVGNEDLSSGTEFTIPGGALWPGRTYQVSLYFTRIKDLDDTSYPGAFAGAGFTSVTDFTITTSGTPAMPAVTLERVGGNVHLTASGGEPNREYVLETSSDLQRWLPQTSMWVGDFPSQHYDGDANYLKKRFYRLRDRESNENVVPHITIQGTVWTDNTHTTPVSGAVMGTSLDGRTTVTDSSGRFFLETDTKSNSGSSQYTITATSGLTNKDFGPWTWGDQPRDQTFEMD